MGDGFLSQVRTAASTANASWQGLHPRFRLALGLTVYRLVLDLSYSLLLSPAYAYSGLVLEAQPLKVILSYVLSVPLVLLGPTRFRRPSDFLSSVLILGVGVPLLSYYGLSAQDSPHVLIMLAGVSIVLASTRVPRVTLQSPRGLTGYVAAASWIALLVAGIVIIARGGLDFYNLRLGDVYEYRYPALEAVGGPVFDYVLHWIPKVILPFLFLFYVRGRKYLLAAVVIAYYLAFLAPVMNAKLFIFIPIALLAAYVVLTHIRDIPGIVLMISALILAAVAYDLTFGSGLATSLGVRRGLFVPAQLNFGYFSTFSELGHVYWSNSVLGHFIDYPFHLPPANLVGEVFLGSRSTHANAGFLATGFMHWGTIGVVFYSVILGALFWLSDSVTRTGSDAVAPTCLLMVPFLSALMSSDLSTSLMTHGVALALVLVWATAGVSSARARNRDPRPEATT